MGLSGEFVEEIGEMMRPLSAVDIARSVHAIAMAVVCWPNWPSGETTDQVNSPAVTPDVLRFPLAAINRPISHVGVQLWSLNELKGGTMFLGSAAANIPEKVSVSFLK